MLHTFATWLQETPISLWLAERLWVVPAVQSLHILAVAVVVGSSLMVALRSFGAVSTLGTLSATGGRFIPRIWIALVPHSSPVVRVIGTKIARQVPEIECSFGARQFRHDALCVHEVPISGLGELSRKSVDRQPGIRKPLFDAATHLFVGQIDVELGSDEFLDRVAVPLGVFIQNEKLVVS